MSVFSHLEFDDHEQLVFVRDKESGLKAIIAVHNTHLGPALGGCRMWPYESDEAALTDVLRLSKGMTYKSAIAGLPLGGGKCVIIGDPRKDKSPQLLRALGRAIEGLSGAYITAEDSGTSVADMVTIGECTQYASGVMVGSEHGGDPSPSTAYGVFVGLQASVAYQLNRTDLTGVKVAVQGVGNVGFHLCKYLKAAGAELIVTDIFPENVQRVVSELGAAAVAPDEIYAVQADVFAPCAMGGIINTQSLRQLQAKVIAGAANNQLSRPEISQQLQAQGVLYAPDYVINAGGIIDIAYQRNGGSAAQLKTHIEAIGTSLEQIFQRAEQSGCCTQLVADQIAAERLSQ
ncbi:MAG: Glu/Leu/Phe/Val dehydrogenase [Oceanospirillaceae bacterium]|nr:Glu/Leu/Phe/Val dehydrogenase [Oceanospirillaceae bacterium]